MGGADRSVVVLASRGGGKRTALSLGVARAVIDQLEQVCWHLQEMSPRSTWSANQWMIASTPFRMQLTRMHKRLGDLTVPGVGDEHNAIHWAFELNDARLDAGRGLRDMELALQSLQCPEISPAERIRETELLTLCRSQLLKSLQRLQCLITQRLPEGQRDV